MRPPQQNFWEALFAAPVEPGKALRVEMRLVRRRGRPFLLLPRQPGPASATMHLYPAQTSRARAVRILMRFLLRVSLPLGTEQVCLAVSPADPFVKFFSSLTGEPSEGVPVVGILAGNPMSEGQRLLVLVFDARLQPVAMVKVGLSEQARVLIEREEGFLTSVPAGMHGVPRLRTAFQSPRLRALALDFFAGDSPRPHHEEALPQLLESWLDPKRRIMVSDAPDWVQLERTCSGDRLFRVLAERVRGKSFQAALYHGDFAPWNIKASPAGAWTVLDWERGELTGIPGWDWFHYVIQSAILVGRLPTSALVQRVDGLLGSEAFRRYAERSGILGSERELVLAYLLHVAEVIEPSEGLAQTRELLQALAGHWRAGETPGPV